MSTTDILSSSTCVCQVRGGIDPIRSAFGTYAGGLANSLPPKIFRKTIEAFVRTFLIIDNPVRCAYRLRTREVTLGVFPRTFASGIAKIVQIGRRFFRFDAGL